MRQKSWLFIYDCICHLWTHAQMLQSKDPLTGPCRTPDRNTKQEQHKISKIANLSLRLWCSCLGPKYTGCKRTCSVEQAVSCIWPLHKAKHALLSTGGSLELGSLHTLGALFWESTSHQPKVLIGYWVNQLSSVKWRGGEMFRLVRWNQPEAWEPCTMHLHVS